MRIRPGLTLIEIIVSIVVFGVGALGLAAGSALVSRQMSGNRQREQSVIDATSRGELLHALPCGAVQSGAEQRNGINAIWTVAGAAAVTLEQSLERSGVNASHTDHFLSAAPCD